MSESDADGASSDDEGGSSPHDFKSSSFSIPTTCGYCKVWTSSVDRSNQNIYEAQTSIWGLSKLGKTCRPCGLSVHTKCELKVGVIIPHPSRLCEYLQGTRGMYRCSW